METNYPFQDESIQGEEFDSKFASELKRFYSKGNRRSGRSSLIAQILVETAIETGDVIHILDHHSIYKNNSMVKNELLRLCELYMDDLKKNHQVMLNTIIDRVNFTIQITINPYTIANYTQLRIKETPRTKNIFPIEKIQARLDFLLSEQNKEFSNLLLII